MYRETNHTALSRRTRVAAAAAALALAASAPAFALTNATATTSFAAVGELGSATGVLIADNWVLTAAHVAKSLTVNSSQFTSGYGSSLVDAVYTYSSSAYPAHDIALVHLSSSVSGNVPILNDSFISNTGALALTSLTIATAQNQEPRGYGSTAGAGTQLSYMDTGTSSVATVNWLLTNGGAALQAGDSGAALFKGSVTDAGGATLLGVGSAALSGGGASSAFVQTYVYKSWIDSTMAASGQQARWLSTSPVPEPGTVALAAIGGIAAIVTARRRRAQQAA